jgi:hypothetical protein
VPQARSSRTTWRLTDAIIARLSAPFDRVFSTTAVASNPPEKLLRTAAGA